MGVLTRCKAHFPVTIFRKKVAAVPGQESTTAERLNAFQNTNKAYQILRPMRREKNEASNNLLGLLLAPTVEWKNDKSCEESLLVAASTTAPRLTRRGQIDRPLSGC